MPTPAPTIIVQTPAGTPAWVSGLFIVAGAVIGGGVALLSTWLSDKRKLRAETESASLRKTQEQRERWDHIVVELCASILAHAANYQNMLPLARRDSAKTRHLLAQPLWVNAVKSLPQMINVLFAVRSTVVARKEVRLMALDVAQLRLVRPVLFESAELAVNALNHMGHPAFNDDEYEEALQVYVERRTDL